MARAVTQGATPLSWDDHLRHARQSPATDCITTASRQVPHLPRGHDHSARAAPCGRREAGPCTGRGDEERLRAVVTLDAMGQFSSVAWLLVQATCLGFFVGSFLDPALLRRPICWVEPHLGEPAARYVAEYRLLLDLRCPGRPPTTRATAGRRPRRADDARWSPVTSKRFPSARASAVRAGRPPTSGAI